MCKEKFIESSSPYNMLLNMDLSLVNSIQKVFLEHLLCVGHHGGG